MAEVSGVFLPGENRAHRGPLQAEQFIFMKGTPADFKSLQLARTYFSYCYF